MTDLLSVLMIICPGYFLAGFTDAVAGGGGIISIPIALFSGIPIHTVYGTNKFAMSMGTSISLFRYGKNGAICWRVALYTAISAAIGAAGGAKLALLLSEKLLSYSLMVLLPIAAVFLSVNKKFGAEHMEKNLSPARSAVYSVLIGLGLGFYDGFFGPGAGTFYIMLFSSVFGFDLLTSTGNSKAANLASNIGALITYIISGKVWFLAGIPAALCAILGNHIGSGLAIKNGAKFIRPMMAVMIALLFLKVFFDLF